MAPAPRVRFAPAPSGYLHVGGAWQALINWLYARSTGGAFVIRFEDTDPATAKAELIEPMLESLRWLGIDWDETYRQSERFPLYREAMEKLLAGGHAYLVDADDRPVEEDGWRQGLAVRFRVPQSGAVRFDDVIREAVTFEHHTIEDFVVWRSNGSPTFYLANAVDDLDMGITHVIRGEDLLSSTPRVLLVRQALGGHDGPVYAHLPLLVNEQRRKLSKRRDDVAVADYRARGYLPQAIRNYLITLGWGAPDGVEIRPIEDVVPIFRLEDMNKSSAFFDIQKLTHFNGEWIRRLTIDEFLDAARPFLDAAPWAEQVDGDRLRRIAPMVQERVATLAEVPAMVDFLFLDHPDTDERSWQKAIAGNDRAPGLLDDAIEAFGAAEWRAEALHATLTAVGERHGLKLAKAQAPVRVAVTGRTVGPPLFESLELLGRDTTLERLRAARARV